jgi:hypothetical protein
MGLMDDKLLKVAEKAGDSILKQSERWSLPQKAVAGLVCFLAAAALIFGIDSLRVTSGVGIALFGVSFLTFRRRVIESETLLLKDKAGKARIAMNAEQGMVFFDDQMHVKMLLNVLNGKPIIHLGSPDTAQIWLAAAPNEAEVVVHGAAPAAASEPIAFMRTKDSQASAMVGILNGAGVDFVGACDGNVGIVLKNEKQESLTVLGCAGSTSHLSFFRGGHDQPIASYPDPDTVARAVIRQTMS